LVRNSIGTSSAYLSFEHHVADYVDAVVEQQLKLFPAQKKTLYRTFEK
jgi:hypothetical protein